MSVTDTIKKDTPLTHRSTEYSDDEKNKIFIAWYNSGKTHSINKLREIIVELGMDVPADSALRGWIRDIFTPRAMDMDSEVAIQIEKKLIADKVEMFQRHAEIAKHVQEISLDYLDKNGLGNAKNAVMALIESIKIERESVGLDKMFIRLKDKTDNELLDELKKLVEGSTIEKIEPVETDES